MACEEMTRPCRGDRGEDREPERSADLLGGVQHRCGAARLVAGTPSLAAVVTATKYPPRGFEAKTQPRWRAKFGLVLGGGTATDRSRPLGGRAWLPTFYRQPQSSDPSPRNSASFSRTISSFSASVVGRWCSSTQLLSWS